MKKRNFVQESRRRELYYLDKRFSEDVEKSAAERERKLQRRAEEKRLEEVINELFGYGSYEEPNVSNR